MHLGGGSVLSLPDVLAVFPENGFVWILREFFGTGEAPGGISMQEFEDRVRSAGDGLRMTLSELKNFGAHVEQAIDCEVVAIRATEEAVLPPGSDPAVAEICAFDRTEWHVAVDDSVGEFQTVLSSVQRIAALWTDRRLFQP